MLEYLQIGVCTMIRINNKRRNYPREDILAELSHEMDLQHYDITEEPEGYLVLTLDISFLEEHIYEFMKKQYSYIVDCTVEETEYALRCIKTAVQTGTVQALADSQELPYFKSNKMIKYMELPKYRDFMLMDYRLITYFKQGKMSLESYDDILLFLEKMIKLQAEEYPLVNNVRIMVG